MLQEFLTRLYTTIVLVGVSVAWYLMLPAWSVSVVLGLLLLFILIFEWPTFKLLPLTPIYPIGPFLALIGLNQSPGRWLFVFACLVAFSHDCGAYLVGKMWGKHKIALSISPGKSYEGFFGGYFFSLSIAYLFLHYQHISLSWPLLIVCIFCLNITSLCGDLFESLLKRRVGIKDSGTLLPGHGGLLDRFDGLMFVAVALYIYTLL